MSVEVRQVQGRKDRYRFVDLPFRLFGDNPGWVPPVRLAVHDRLSPKHPASEHQQWCTWMAWRDGRAVGRIGACVDRMFDEFHGLSWAWIGFFEAADDTEATRALFDTAWSWGRDHGATMATGPASFTTNDECGLQIDGFDSVPQILTPQNPAYYEALWLDAGWEPAMDLWSWEADRHQIGLSDRQKHGLERLRQRSDLHIREMRMKDFDAEVGRFFKVYNRAWAHNWGFAPMTEAEVRHLAKDLKQIIDPTLGLFVENAAGEQVAVALALPDTNEALRLHMRSGRLLPLGWAHLLLGVKRTARVRVLALGVVPELQSRAVGPMLYQALAERTLAKTRVQSGEASWILSTNTAMNKALAGLGGRRGKTWRLYQHAL